MTDDDGQNQRGSQQPVEHLDGYARLRSIYDDARAQGNKYLLICVDSFDWEDPDGGLYEKPAGSLKDAMDFEKTQFTGIDYLIGILDLQKPFEQQVHFDGALERVMPDTEALRRTAARDIPRAYFVDPVREMNRQAETIGSNVEYIEEHVHEPNAPQAVEAQVKAHCQILKNLVVRLAPPISVLARIQKKALRGTKIRPLPDVSHLERAVLDVETGVRDVTEQVHALVTMFHPLTKCEPDSSHAAGYALGLMNILVLESGENMIKAAVSIGHALERFAQLLKETM